MPDLSLSAARQEPVTAVPNRLIDCCLADTNGEYLKVYLYLLRHLSDPEGSVSISDIADALDHSEKDVVRALRYWSRKDMLSLEYDTDSQISGICITGFLSPDEPGKIGKGPNSGRITLFPAGEPRRESSPGNAASVSLKQPTWTSAGPEMRTHTADEIRQLSEDKSVNLLFFAAEKYLRRTLTQTDMEYILFWIDEINGLGMTCDLAEYVIESCANEGHTAIGYLNRVAMSWHEKNITTRQEAIDEAASFQRAYSIITRSLGLRRNLSPSERSQVDVWTREWGITDDLLSDACQRTADWNPSKAFPYLASILSDWHKAGVSSLEEVKAFEEEKAGQREKKTAGEKKGGSPRKSKSRNSSQDNRPTGQFYRFQGGDYDYEAIARALRKT